MDKISNPEWIALAKLVAERCAEIAEEQARVYSGEHSEGAGCHRAAHAIRIYANSIGDKHE